MEAGGEGPFTAAWPARLWGVGGQHAIAPELTLLSPHSGQTLWGPGHAASSLAEERFGDEQEASSVFDLRVNSSILEKLVKQMKGCGIFLK